MNSTCPVAAALLNLSKDLTSWRGKPFSAQEKKQFNLGDMLGETCQIQIMEKGKQTQCRNGPVRAGII